VSEIRERLLDGIRVAELGGEPVAIAGRILADLGAEVTALGPDDVPRRSSGRARVWSAGKRTVDVERPVDRQSVLAEADIVLAMPAPGTASDSSGAPHAVWVDATPFGATGPRAAWDADDLAIMATTGNLSMTGDPDRAPVRCAEPLAHIHGGPEIAFAALTALASGRRPCHVDVSLQEAVLVANMGAVGRYARERSAGRRRGANIGRTREIWPCADGYVSFGLRGGKARLASLRLLVDLVTDGGFAPPAFAERDWATFDHNAATDDELAEIEAAVGAYFAAHTMTELHTIATRTNLMLAPANSPAEIYASAQLRARQFFGSFDGLDGLPMRFVRVRSIDGNVEAAGPRSVHAASAPRTPPPRRSEDHPPDDELEPTSPWQGVCLLELGSGAAGPIATRYFAEHGATVVRIESRSRPDFLRTYSPGGLDQSTMFDALNVGKRSITLNLKHPDGAALGRRLMTEWADAVSENFAPKAMRGFGLDYGSVAVTHPDLVMASCCLNGQTGPHQDYPGFGGQGAALSGFNFLTGWPDREPIGPFGTITDSLAPRYVATALAAGLLYRRRTGRGVHLDLSQVECALFALSPWLVDFVAGRSFATRIGGAGVEPDPDAGPDRWRVPGRGKGQPWIPVQDFADCFGDPQLRHRDHFVALDHPVLGPGEYERNGFRVDGLPAAYDRAAPTLGQDTKLVLGEVLGLSSIEQERLREAGALDD
jgi:crotonobetainyl-CoA:carnitine CoA-transferase CaiB-like acyl-CoA transferase